MGQLFNEIFYQPIFSVLLFIYQNLALEDLGIAIVILTILVRVVLFPVFYRSAKDQAVMQRLQPHIKKIQLDHKDNKEKQAAELLALYRKHKFNPFSGFVFLILQLPIFIALFQLFTNKETLVTAFTNHTLLGFVSLDEKNLIIVILAAALQYWQGKLSLQPSNLKKGGGTAPGLAVGRTMVFLAPGFTVLILAGLPSALGLYWMVSNLFSVFQQFIINRKLPDLNHGKLDTQNKNNPRVNGVHRDKDHSR